MAIEGLDVSHWQGELSDEAIVKMVLKGVKFAYVKFSQGKDMADDRAEHNAMALQAAGILTGAYHFVTRDNALEQYSWFLRCVGDFKMDLPPAMDCEKNTDGTFPTQAIVDVMGRKLTDWMKTQPKLAAYPYPAIYTNPSYGNKIFTDKIMGRYLLWIAHWRVEEPRPPTVWTGQSYFIWQDGVVEGAPYGIVGQVDHDVWGPYMPFPGSQPATNEMVATLKYPDGSVFQGMVKEVVA